MRGTIVTDTFTRTLASGWGSADTGQAWSTVGVGGSILASDWTVGSGFGTQSVPAVLGYRLSYLAAFSQAFVDVSVTGSVSVMPLGAPLEVANLAVRGTSTSTYYLLRAQVETSGAVTAKIFNPGGTQLGSITVPNLTYIANLQIRVRAQAVGRVLRMKVWRASDPEPVAWVLSVVDSTYTGPGWIGVRSGVASGNTNTLPVAFSYDNFSSVLLPDFPRDPLPLTVLAAFGADLSADPSTWPWKNITTDVRAGTVSITPGRGDESSQASPASCSFQLLNDSKAYSAYNPTGPNYPYVRRNTPIWVLVDPATRFFGYANGFVPSWDTTGKQAVVSVSASGILRRLTQGKTPLHSPLYRFLAATSPIAWWSLEDGVDSTQAASGLVGGSPMTVAADVMKFVGDGPAGATGSAQPDVNAVNSLNGTIVGGSATAWQVSVWTKGVRTNPVDSYYVAAEVRTDNGKIYRLIIQRYTGASTAGWAYYASESATDATNFITEPSKLTIDTGWHLLQATMTQSGSNTIASFWLDGVLVGTQTWTGLTMGRPVRASAIGNFTPGTADLSLGMKEIYISHIAVHNTATLVNQYRAGLGYPSETATDRLSRLCAEEGVPITITGTSDTAMGPQTVNTFVSLLKECEAADLGLLYDGFDPGLGYITRSARYNQTPALSLDVAAGQVDTPFAPADDDQRNRNLYKVDRKNGSSATYEDRTGPLGTDAIGVYDSSVTVSVATDDVLPHYASWLVHAGTVEGFRYPSLNLDLAATPGIIDDWVAARLNSRIDVLNVDSKATGHAPGTVSVLDEGYTETLSPFGYKVAANCSPERPWEVFVLDTDRLDADSSSQLVSGISTTATTLQVQTANIPGAAWTTDPTEWTAPKTLHLDVGGEQMKVTNIVGTTSPQTITVVRSVNGVVKAQSAGTHVGLWQPRVMAL